MRGGGVLISLVHIGHPMMRYQRFLTEAMKIPRENATPWNLIVSIRVDPIGLWQKDVQEFAAWPTQCASDSEVPYPTIRTIGDVVGFANRFFSSGGKCSRQECLELVRWCTDRMESIVISDDRPVSEGPAA